MSESSDLRIESSNLREKETIYRLIGSVVLGIAVFSDVLIGADIASNGIKSIGIPVQLYDIYANAMGVGMLSYTSSLGRRADVIDAALLRHETEAETLAASHESVHR
jgi:hypothetical protein